MAVGGTQALYYRQKDSKNHSVAGSEDPHGWAHDGEWSMMMESCIVTDGSGIYPTNPIHI